MLTAEEFVDTITGDLLGRRVFVFTPLGRRHEPPARKHRSGLRLLHRRGTRHGGSERNGVAVDFDVALKNADVVEIVTRETSGVELLGGAGEARVSRRQPGGQVQDRAPAAIPRDRGARARHARRSRSFWLMRGRPSRRMRTTTPWWPSPTDADVLLGRRRHRRHGSHRGASRRCGESPARGDERWRGGGTRDANVHRSTVWLRCNG